MFQGLFRNKEKSAIINTWVQTFAFIMAGVWAIYTFVYKEIYTPYFAPAHLTANFEITKQEHSLKNKEALKLNFRVSNTGNKLIKILPSMYTVWGVKLNENNANDHEVIDTVTLSLNNGNVDGNYWNVKHYKWDKSSLRVIAAGQIFNNYKFEPGESSNSNVIVHVPQGEYDVVYGHLWLLGAEEDKALKIQWEATSSTDAVFSVHAPNKKGDYELLIADQSQKDKKALEKYGFLMVSDTTVQAL